jgi:sodium transport system ATP-binding protein
MLQISGLSKVYNAPKQKTRGETKATHKALEPLNLNVSGGQVYGLLGPNGAGKTTLLRCLATLLTPSSGTATLAGFDIQKEPEKVRQILGVVNGGMGLYDRLTGREILEYFAGFYGMPQSKVQSRILELDDLLELGDALTKRTMDHSTGMKQKIVIARAVIHDPQVLILDEAASGLDILARRALLDFVKSYKAQNRLVLYSTHVMDEIEEVSERAAILYKGRLLEEGTLEEIKSRSGERKLENAFFELVKAEEERLRAGEREGV